MKLKTLLFLLLALLVSVSASAYDAEIDGIYYNFSDGKAIVTYRDYSYNSYSGSVVIPESVTHNGTTYSVTSIGNSAFYECSGLTSVTIPNSVTSIGYQAFRGCSGLTSVTIPSSVTSIGGGAFEYCRGLTSVTIPNSVTSIGYDAFRDCSGLTSVTIPESVTSIGSSAFKNCSGLTSVTIPSSVTSIGYDAFYGCYFAGSSFVNNSTLTSNNNWGATLFDEETSDGLLITDNIVKKCRSWATSVTIPNSVTSIGDYAFSGCSGLTSVSIPNSVTSIGNYAFPSCSSLTSVTIPNSVTSIGNYAFRGCSGLTSVTIGNGVTSIGQSAFQDCTNLASVTIPSSVTSIGSSAFSGCYFVGTSFVNNSTLTSDNNWGARLFDEETSDGLLITDNIVKKCRSWATSVTIPEGVTSIGGSAFQDCTNLTSVTIPNSVTSIGGSAFQDCTNLTSVTIPNSVTSIGSSVFYNCRNLTSITIPDGVTSIGYYAFYECSGLTSVTIPESVTSIGNSAFAGCRGLTSLTIPNSVTSIGNYAFYGCRSLTSITIPANVTTIGEDVFRSCEGLETVNINSSQVGTRMFMDCSSLSTLNLGSNVTTIGESAFGHCSALTSLHIPQNVSSIGERAFQGCNIETITVEDGNTVYDSRDNCNAIIQTSYNRLVVGCKNTTIPETVKSIGNYAFLSLNLSEIIIPDNVVSIREGAFAGTTINHIVIPASVTSIGGGCFSSAKIVLIEFPYSETEINYDSDEGSVFEYTEIGTLINDRTLEMYDWCSHDCGAFSEAKIDKVIAGPHAFATFRYSTITDYYWPKEKTLVYQSYSFYSYGNNSFRGGGNSTVKYLHLPKGVTTIDKVFSADTIDIPASVTSIKDEAFECYPKKVYMYKRTPLAISASTFKGRSSTTLYVPRGCKAAYEAADYWKEFKNIVEFIYGDVNSDEEVDVLDVVDIVRYVVDDPADTFVPILADINNSGEVNVGDAVALVNEIAGDQNFVKPWRAPQQNSAADDVLTLTSTDNGMSLCMENERNYTAFQLDLYLPAGTDATDMLLNAQRKQGHQLIYNKVENGHYRVAAISTSNSTFSGYEGELLAVGLEGVANEDICLRNIRFFTTDGEEHRFDDIVMQSGTATDIASPRQSSYGDEAIYNLAGQRIQKTQKGINIVNGKKIAF